MGPPLKIMGPLPRPPFEMYLGPAAMEEGTGLGSTIQADSFLHK